MSWLQKIMYGRYGVDPLSLGLMVLYFVLYLLSGILRWGWLSWLALLPVVFALLRMFSRNVPKRRAENAKFMALVGPAVRWFKMRRTIHRDKEHAYFKCPNCGQYLRVPKGKGKLTVTCRNCGVSFEEKT
ncbi:MAG: hypothetical protein RRY53_06960 [Pseudoflavonifractor sp.]